MVKELFYLVGAIESNTIDMEETKKALVEKRPSRDLRPSCWLSVCKEIRNLIDCDKNIVKTYNSNDDLENTQVSHNYSFVDIFMGIEDILSENLEFYPVELETIFSKYRKYRDIQFEKSHLEQIQETNLELVNTIYKLTSQLNSETRKIKALVFEVQHMQDICRRLEQTIVNMVKDYNHEST